jgi:RIO kinase 1
MASNHGDPEEVPVLFHRTPGMRRSQGRDHFQQLDSFFSQGLITEILGLVKIGKEASVYRCQGGSELGGRPVAAKVYRARQYRFKNDAAYQQERTRGMRGQDRRAFVKKTGFGQKVRTGSWVAHEYETLKELYDAGADVPEPLAFESDVMLMEYIGDEEETALQLNQVRLDPEEAPRLFERVVSNVELLLASNRVHGDLSAHNILYWLGSVVLIDFPQAVDARFNSNARAFLARDVENVCRYFNEFGVKADGSRLADDLWWRYMRAEL